MRRQNHVHRFKRHVYTTGNKVFFCTLPECQFKVDCALALGKKSICNRCGREFILNEYSITLAKPHCDSCSRKKMIVDGQPRFISPKRVLQDLAADTTKNLSERLVTVVSEAEDDI